MSSNLRELVLPSFQLFAKEPKIPHRRRKLANCQDEFGITYEVVSSWPSNVWYVLASKDGYKMANAKQTRNPEVANQWIEAVRDGRVRTADSGLNADSIT